MHLIYNDDNVYRMRKCIGTYTDLALKVRSTQDEYDALCKCCADAGIDIPNIAKTDASGISGDTKFHTDMAACVEAYDILIARQKALSCANKKLKKCLKKEGVI